MSQLMIWTIAVSVILIPYSVCASDGVCFRCGGRQGECLNASRVCNNFVDCPDASDERTAAGGGCFMKKVCANQAAQDEVSHNKMVTLYILVGVVSFESLLIFVVALFVVIRRRPETPCKHNSCKKRRDKKLKKHTTVLNANVNIYEMESSNRAKGDSRKGPFFTEASGGKHAIVTHRPPSSKDVRSFNGSSGSGANLNASYKSDGGDEHYIYEHIKH